MTAKVLDGRYKLIKKLGAGGFGHTYMARDMRRPGSPLCVVKHLKPANTDAEFLREARRLFNTEAEVLEKLGRHDQIPQLLAYFEENQQFFLVQEYIEGTPLNQEWKAEPAPDQPLSQPLPTKKITEAEAIALLKDVLGILEFVHAEGVVHRDIKPDNLIRRKSDGKIVLIDFGAVKAFQSDNPQQESQNGRSSFTVSIGTPGYMASEQMAGRPNFTSDLYSLGMVIIRGLTGIEPTELPTHPDTGELIWKDKVRISNGLAMVLTRMTRYNYPQRFPSAREALQGINAFCPSEETSAAPLASLTSTRTSSKKPNNDLGRLHLPPSSSSGSNAGAGVLIGGLLVFMAIAVLGMPALLNRPKEAPNTATAPTATPVPTPNATETPPETTPSPAVPDMPPPITNEVIGIDASGNGSVSAVIPPNGISNYLLNANSGQNLAVSLKGNDVIMTILGTDKQPLANARDVKEFSGNLTSAGTYTVQVRSIQSAAPTNFSLIVSLTGAGSDPNVINRPIIIKPR
jgi:serine/threonine protein kinase